ncbi:MAG: hypothetical protein KGJ30_06985, partial [Burkholderiales bacterium]|nr:hypothetical protein [Burkholderiales bacterium]
FSIVGLPANHIPTTASCEVCHLGAGSSIAAAPVLSGARFAGSLMNHAGIGSGCVACHTAAGSPAAFTGITRIVGMPATAPVGVGSHIPSSTNCETCHLATLPAGLIAASATKTAPGTAFATPAPNTAQIHTGITSGCSTCHDTNAVWMGTSAYPIAPAALTPGASYTGFHARPTAAGGADAIADAAHPAGGDCSQCHASTNAFTGVDKPANHIPYAATAQCSNCHTGTDYSVLPTLANIHAYAPNINTNCAQCHGSAAPSFALPAANFSIVGLPATHIPTSASCEVCHVGAASSVATLPVPNGAKFANSQMSHSGIASNCVACHVAAGSSSSFAGIARVVAMPPTTPAGASSHIPSGTSCETCHLASMPAGNIPASATATAPGTAFANPAPNTAQIHTGITSGCTSCHEGSDVWMGMGSYPISPSTLSPGASYTGFQARPGASGGPYRVADAAHPAGGDCIQCHANTVAFTAADKPANHIPTAATATCDNCHTSADYSVLPTLTNIHAYAPSTSTNCAQCHGSAAASYAIPAASFAIVGLPSNHLPTSASCEVCHVGAGSSIAATPVVDGAKFTGSLMNHAGIGSGCVSCHVAAGTPAAFAGIAAIVGMPATTPIGSASHIPSATSCESCHLQTLPVGLIAASATKTAPGTAFATPAPTTLQIHAGITSGCTACHEASDVWMGMAAYPIAPATLTAGASYTGFQTRPVSAAGPYNIADPAHPASGDCAGCHASTTAFTGVDKPANHIPYAATAACNACHQSSDYSVMPTLTAIHANAPSTSANCAQCHGSAAATFAIPAANFSIVGLPSNHIPTSSSCEVCHVGAGSSIAATPVVNGARFAGSAMSHSGITVGCNSCHVPAGTAVSFIGITSIVGMPPTSPMGAGAHVPVSTTCENCHATSAVAGLIPASATKSAPGTLFATPAPTTAQIHAGITSGCTTCHEANNVWMGMGAYPIAPSVVTAGAQYTGFQTRPVAAASTYGIADAAHPSSGDCATCHLTTSYFVGVDKPANHIPYAAAAQCSNCHTSNDYSALPTLTNIHAWAPSTSANCAQCHGSAAPTFAIPAANFSIVGLPSNHIPTTASCEVCHVGAGSSIAATPVLNGAKFAGSRMSHSGITVGCNSCHLTAGSVMNFAGITSLVGMPPTTPVGAASHIPSSSTCENCHGTGSVAGLIPASATKTPPGTLFNTPAPTTAQIHTGITSGCSTCHDTGDVWMGVSAYPIAPTTLSSGAQYTGFQTRPVAAAGTYAVADAAHPTSGDCSNCHTGTSYFSGAAKPAGHIPTSAACATCHIVAGDYTIAGLASNTVLHTGIVSGCANCHAAGPFAGSGPTSSTLCTTAALPYQPVPKPLPACAASPTASNAATHIPVGSQACELCHGSSNFTSFKMASTTAMRPTTTTGPVPGTTMHTSGVPQTSFTCESCHEYQYTWYGVSIRTRPSTGHNAGKDCGNSGCHTNTRSSFSDLARLRPIPVRRAAIGAALPRLLPQLMGSTGLTGTNSFDHHGVAPGQCQSCHNGQLATGRPARHYGQRLSCDSCHRTTAWRPAQFSHNATMTGQCVVCHNGVDAPGRPGGHFVSVRSCDACHTMLAWQPVQYQHLSPAYQPRPDKPSCISCHLTNNELIPRQMHGLPGLRPVPVPGK